MRLESIYTNIGKKIKHTAITKTWVATMCEINELIWVCKIHDYIWLTNIEMGY